MPADNATIGDGTIVEPGVTVAFEERVGSGIRIGSQATQTGTLVAVGTAEKPITFTSGKDSKAPGDWMSLYFKAPTASGNKISYAKVEYAGGPASTTGFGCGPGRNDAAGRLAREHTVDIGMPERERSLRLPAVDGTP